MITFCVGAARLRTCLGLRGGAVVRHFHKSRAVVTPGCRIAVWGLPEPNVIVENWQRPQALTRLGGVDECHARIFLRTILGFAHSLEVGEYGPDSMGVGSATREIVFLIKGIGLRFPITGCASQNTGTMQRNSCILTSLAIFWIRSKCAAASQWRS